MSASEKSTVGIRIEHTVMSAVYCVAIAVWASMGVAVGQVAASGRQGLAVRSKWDEKFLSVQLNGVHVKADSAIDAWQKQLSKLLGIRTVLYIPSERPTTGVFKFDAETCVVSDVLNAFVSAYPDYIYTQDKNTGVVWLHPKAIAFTDILPARIKVAKDAMAVPMVTGVLDKLAGFGSLGIQVVSKRSTTGLGTYDYPVDLPEGTYSVRDIVNLCCVASPRTALYLSQMNGSVLATPDIIGSWDGHQAPPTAAAYWKSEIGAARQGLPSDSELIDALSSGDERIRLAARNYIDLCWMVPKVLALKLPETPPERALWTAIAMLSVYGRTETATHPKALERVAQILATESDSSISSGVRTVATLELAQGQEKTLAWLTKLGPPVSESDIAEASSNLNYAVTALEQVASRSLASNEVANVKHDLHRLAWYSKHVRSKLVEKNPQWAGFSKDDIQALDNSKVFSLP